MTTHTIHELTKLAKLAVSPAAFTPDTLDMPIPDAPILDGPAYRRKWDPARFSSFAEDERARKADQDALNEGALYCWLRTLPRHEAQARWKYTLDTRAHLRGERDDVP